VVIRASSLLRRRDAYPCNRCKRLESLTRGTLFAQTRLPLHTWFPAIRLLARRKNRSWVPALRRQLGVSYNTVRLLTSSDV